MSWLKPLDFVPPPAPVIRKKPENTNSPMRSVRINGVRYRSMAEAARALDCGYREIYRRLGESWRYGCRKA
jgi:hypothetical protein